MSNERVKTIKERKVEEKITVRMTDTYLFDFTLYHTYSKLAGFLTNILVAAIAFMGIIMLVMGKDKTRADYFLSGSSGCVYCF